jgi:hypothetical protein
LWRRICLLEILFSPFLKVATIAFLLLQNRLRIWSLWTFLLSELFWC